MQLNHIFRTRDLVKKNEAKLAKLQENVKADVLNNEAFLDRGFTRSKVFTYVYSYSSDNEFVRHRHLLSVNADSSFALAYPSIGCDKGYDTDVATFLLVLQNTLQISQNPFVITPDLSLHQYQILSLVVLLEVHPCLVFKCIDCQASCKLLYFLFV